MSIIIIYKNLNTPYNIYFPNSHLEDIIVYIFPQFFKLCVLNKIYPTFSHTWFSTFSLVPAPSIYDDALRKYDKVCEGMNFFTTWITLESCIET